MLPVPDIAQFARLAVETIGADEGECLVSPCLGIGVDCRQVDAVAHAEPQDRIASPTLHRTVGQALEDEHVTPPANIQPVGAGATGQAVMAAMAENRVFATTAVEDVPAVRAVRAVDRQRPRRIVDRAGQVGQLAGRILNRRPTKVDVCHRQIGGHVAYADCKGEHECRGRRHGLVERRMRAIAERQRQTARIGNRDRFVQLQTELGCLAADNRCRS